MRIQACRTCGVEFEIYGRQPYKYCETHRVSDAVRRARALRNLRKRRREARSPVQCRTCGIEFKAMRSDAKCCTNPECKRKETNARARKYHQSHRGTCVNCGIEVAQHSKQCLRCSQKDRIAKITGPNNYAWKGGRRRDIYGYIHILIAPEAAKGHRYRPEHHVVWEAANGPLPKGYVVHHLNHIKDDNRLENLEAMPRRKHNHQHGEQRIKELEAEVARLREQLDGNLRSEIPSEPE